VSSGTILAVSSLSVGLNLFFDTFFSMLHFLINGLPAVFNPDFL
jgi:hypothetical protein